MGNGDSVIITMKWFERFFVHSIKGGTAIPVVESSLSIWRHMERDFFICQKRRLKDEDYIKRRLSQRI